MQRILDSTVKKNCEYLYRCFYWLIEMNLKVKENISIDAVLLKFNIKLIIVFETHIWPVEVSGLG